MKLEHGNKRFWNRWAGIYDKFMNGNQLLYDEIAIRIKQHLNQQMNVLELACGTGLISEQISHCVKTLEATDFSTEMISEAQKKGGPAQLHYSVQDATDLPYSADAFDAVVIANALHIMPEPEKVMREICRVLKPDGILFAPTFVHGDSTDNRFRIKIMELAGFKAYNKWSDKELAAFILKYGFELTKIETLGSNIAPLCYLEAKNKEK